MESHDEFLERISKEDTFKEWMDKQPPTKMKESIERLTNFSTFINKNLTHGAKSLTQDEREWLYSRFEWGERHYGERFKQADMVKELREELADAMIYMFLMMEKQKVDMGQEQDGVAFCVARAIQLSRGMTDE